MHHVFSVYHTYECLLIFLSCASSMQVEFVPQYIQAIDFTLNVTAVGASRYTTRTFLVRIPVTQASRDFNHTIAGLLFNTSYTLYIRADGEYQWCPYNELLGRYSEPVIVSTGDMC